MHSKTPWSVFGTKILDGEDQLIARIFHSDDDMSVCLADVRLMAAAPDLLRAARLARSALLSNRVDSQEEALDALDAAIARAEGASNE